MPSLPTSVRRFSGVALLSFTGVAAADAEAPFQAENESAGVVNAQLRDPVPEILEGVEIRVGFGGFWFLVMTVEGSDGWRLLGT